MSYGASINEILGNITVPSTAVLNVINDVNETVPLKILRSDTTYAETQVSFKIYFEVVAQNGTDKITYQLVPSTTSSDAYVLSDIYDVDQDLFFINFINNNTTVSTFLSNITAVEGATLKILDKLGFERTMGIMAYDDILQVTSENGEVVNNYYLGFKAEIETGSTDAYILSSVYTVDQEALTISDVPENVTIADFRDNLTAALGATFIVADGSGVEQTTGTVLDGYQVIVTSENGANMVSYSVSVITGRENFLSRRYKVYPNPASSHIFVDGLEKGDVIHVVSMLGVNCEVIEYESYRGSLSLESLQTGIYFIQIKSEGNLSTFKIVKR
jgi:hypothetical protein